MLQTVHFVRLQLIIIKLLFPLTNTLRYRSNLGPSIVFAFIEISSLLPKKASRLPSDESRTHHHLYVFMFPLDYLNAEDTDNSVKYTIDS
jgi:hypothetical protein